ncbi:PAS domain S-box protein [Flexithrix dorotheae]|uniref:PAS domain S-box protein n=1 Tax=Flexithrix dorotheae TaxID=70993 RepID=UPI000379D8C0|nr:PAS domain S-box protein [Flexithrix dorotheae]
MPNQDSSPQQNGSSYKILLIFVLTFQSLLATGWLVYDNFNVYLEKPDEINLMSLIASGLGALIVIIVGIFLFSSENKSAKEVEQSNKKLKEKESSVQEREDQIAFLNKGLTFDYSKFDLKSFFEIITKEATKNLKVHRAGIWLFNSLGSELTCRNIYDKENDQHSFGETISTSNHINLIGNIKTEPHIISDKAWMDKKLEELGDYYFKSSGVRSIMIVSIVVENKTLGVFWFEQKKSTRHWSNNDLEIAKALIGFFKLYLTINHSSRNQKELKESHQDYAAFFNSSDTAIGKFDLEANHNINLSIEEQTKSLISLTKVAHFNDAFSDLFSLKSPQSVKEFDLKQVLGLEDKEKTIQRFIENGYKLFHEEVSLSEDRKAIRGLFGIVENNRLKGIWVSMVDITTFVETEENVFEATVENASELIVIIDPQGRVNYSNKAFKENIQVFETEPTDRDFRFDDLLESGYIEKYTEAVNAVISERRPELLLSIPLKSNLGIADEFDCYFNLLPGKNGEDQILVELKKVKKVVEVVEERKESEDQQFYKSLLEETPGMIALVNKSADIIYENKAMRKQFEKNNESRKGHYGFDFVAPENLEAVNLAFEEVLGEEGLTLTVPIKFSPSTDYLVEGELVLTNLLQDEAVNGILVQLNEPKQIVEIKEKIVEVDRENNEHPLFEDFLNNSSSAFIRTDQNFSIDFSSKGVSKFGYSSEELENTKFPDLLHDEEKGQIEQLAGTETNGQPNRLRIKSKEGEWIQAEVTGTRISEEGKDDKFLFQINDFSKVAKRESELLFRAKFYNVLLGNISSPLLFIDKTSKIKYLSPAAKSLLGYSLKARVFDYMEPASSELLGEKLDFLAENPDQLVNLNTPLKDNHGNVLAVTFNIRNVAQTSSMTGFVLEVQIENNNSPTPDIDEKMEKGLPDSKKKVDTKSSQNNGESTANIKSQSSKETNNNSSKLNEIENSGNSIVLMNASGKILLQNSSFEKLTGISRDSLQKENIQNLLSPNDQPKLISLFIECLQKDKQVAKKFNVVSLPKAPLFEFEFTNYLKDKKIKAIQLKIKEVIKKKKFNGNSNGHKLEEGDRGKVFSKKLNGKNGHHKGEKSLLVEE